MRNKLLMYGIAAAVLAFQSCKDESSAVKKQADLNSVKQTAATANTTLTNWFKRNTNSLGSIAYDQAASVVMGSGNVLWLFGDTFYNDLDGSGKVPCWNPTSGPAFNKRNTVLKQPSKTNYTQSSTTNLTYAGEPQIFQTLTPATTCYWPCSGVDVGGTPYIALIEVNSGTGAFVNNAIGAINLATNGISYTFLPSTNGISFNIGMVKVGTTIYMFGYKMTGSFGTTNVYVAKSSTSTPTSFTYWNGSALGWLSTPPNPAANTNGVITSTLSNAISVSYISSKSKFVIVECAWNFGCGASDDIFGRSSSSATGAFTTPVKIYDIPDRNAGNIPFFYTPMVHPQYNTATGFTMTYCINFYEPCVASCSGSKANPDQYRPRAVDVPFSELGI